MTVRAPDQEPLQPGIIEGFFGRPWPESARLAYGEFLRAQDFGYYIYAPKADSHLRQRWREPMPAEELARLTTLSEQFREKGLRFGIGLTPYEIHLNYDADARALLKKKVAQLDQIGVDMLGILFDDTRCGIAQLALQQARVVADITNWSSATGFIVCPTYYSDDPILGQLFGQGPARYLQDLGRYLDPAVDVFWTGQKVCSPSYPDSHLRDVIARLGRKPFIWDNRIANDGRARCSYLYLDPLSAGWSLNTRLVSGFAINPMNQPGLSRVALAAYGSKLAEARSGDKDATFELNVRSECGAALGSQILCDLDLFQNQGLLALDASARTTLAEKYRSFDPQCCAREIVAWLMGEYAFDPNCLTA